MKCKQIIRMAFTVAAFTIAVGCKPASDEISNPSSPSETAADKLDKTRQETKAVAATKDYAYAQKGEFVDNMRAELADLNRQMEALSAKVENSTASAKEEAKAKLQALREKSADLSKRLDEVGNATESTWDEVKAGFKKAYEETKKSFNEARQWLSEKIAP